MPLRAASLHADQVVAAAVAEQPRLRLICLAVGSALCSASSVLLLLRIRRSLRVVKRAPRQLARPDEFCPTTFDAKLLRPISQQGLSELAQQLTGYATSPACQVSF